MPRRNRNAPARRTQQAPAHRNQALPDVPITEAFDATVAAGLRLSGERGLEGWGEADLIAAGGDPAVLRARKAEVMTAIRRRFDALQAV